jgi:hypothetical protein
MRDSSRRRFSGLSDVNAFDWETAETMNPTTLKVTSGWKAPWFLIKDLN